MSKEDDDTGMAVAPAGQAADILAVIIGFRFRSEKPESDESEQRMGQNFLTPEQEEEFRSQFAGLGADVCATAKVNVDTEIGRLNRLRDELETREEELRAQSESGNGRDDSYDVSPTKDKTRTSRDQAALPSPAELPDIPGLPQAGSNSWVVLGHILKAGEKGISGAGLSPMVEDIYPGKDDKERRRALSALLSSLKGKGLIEKIVGYGGSYYVAEEHRKTLAALFSGRSTMTAPRRPSASGSPGNNAEAILLILRQSLVFLTVNEIVDKAMAPGSGYDTKGRLSHEVKKPVQQSLLQGKGKKFCRTGDKPAKWGPIERKGEVSKKEDADDNRPRRSKDPSKAKKKASSVPTLDLEALRQAKKAKTIVRPRMQEDWDAILRRALEYRLGDDVSFTEIMGNIELIGAVCGFAPGGLIGPSRIHGELSRAVISFVREGILTLDTDDHNILTDIKIRPASRVRRTSEGSVDSKGSDPDDADVAAKADATTAMAEDSDSNPGLEEPPSDMDPDSPADDEEPGLPEEPSLDDSNLEGESTSLEDDPDGRKIVIRADDWDAAVRELVASSEGSFRTTDIVQHFQDSRGTDSWVLPESLGKMQIADEVSEAIDRCSEDDIYQDEESSRWRLQ